MLSRGSSPRGSEYTMPLARSVKRAQQRKMYDQDRERYYLEAPEGAKKYPTFQQWRGLLKQIRRKRIEEAATKQVDETKEDLTWEE